MHPFEEKFDQSWPADRWCDVSVVAAVSGGADSVAMLRALASLKRQTGGQGGLHVMHVDHGLRGEESDADARFVESLCDELDVQRTIVRLPEIDAKELQGQGLESILRRKRYDVMTERAEQIGARYLVTAHTADDQAETVLHRVIRGTGIRGLAGIPRTRQLSHAVTLIRPMLEIRRSEVVGYLDDLEVSYRTDTSNIDPRFTRNRIRNELLPQLAADYNPQVVEALLRLGRQAGAVRSIIDKQVVDLAERAVSDYQVETEEGLRDGFQVDTRALGSASRDMVRHLLVACWSAQNWPLRDMSYAHWEQLATLIEENSVDLRSVSSCVSSKAAYLAQSKGEQLFPGEVSIQKKGYFIIFSAMKRSRKSLNGP